MDRTLTMTKFRVIQEFAEHTIADFEVRVGFRVDPPVPVDFIAKALYQFQIKLQKKISASPKVVATLIVAEMTIYIRAGRSLKSIRFSIAHEIGHWVLHIAQLYQGNYSFNSHTSTTDGFQRNNRKFRKRQKELLDQQESQAHYFARALLCPISMLLQEARKYEKIDFEALKNLADKFCVSREVMYYRLRELYDYSFWEGPNIDWNTLRDRFPNISSRTPISNVKNVNFTRQIQPRPSQTKDFEPPKFIQPYIVEFCGTPRSGKDTEIEIVMDVLQDIYGFKVRVVDEGIKDCFIDKKLDLERFFKSTSHAVDELYGARYENPGNCDFVLFNRNIFDRLAFLPALHSLDRITHEKEMIHTNYLLSYTHLIDKVLLFQISPEESLRREYEYSREIVEQIGKLENLPVRNQTMFNLESLSIFNAAYIQTFEKYQNQFGEVLLFEGDTVSKFQRSVEILYAILPTTNRQLPMPALLDHFVNSQSKRKLLKSSIKNNPS